LLDIIRIRLTENVIRKTMTKDEIATDILRHMEITGCTQDSAADAFGLSAGYISKLLAPIRHLIPELQYLSDNPKVTRDVLRIVATMPTSDLQKQLAERVLADIERHGRAKRNVIERLAAEMKGTNRARRVHRAAVKKDGASFVYPGDWAWERLAAFLGDLYERAKREAKKQAEGKVVHPVSSLQQLM
jgi:ParB-like chromosome segregation protein Spo0J